MASGSVRWLLGGALLAGCPVDGDGVLRLPDGSTGHRPDAQARPTCGRGTDVACESDAGAQTKLDAGASPARDAGTTHTDARAWPYDVVLVSRDAQSDGGGDNWTSCDCVQGSQRWCAMPTTRAWGRQACAATRRWGACVATTLRPASCEGIATYSRICCITADCCANDPADQSSVGECSNHLVCY